jgi:hypothetical protein
LEESVGILPARSAPLCDPILDLVIIFASPLTSDCSVQLMLLVSVGDCDAQCSHPDWPVDTMETSSIYFLSSSHQFLIGVHDLRENLPNHICALPKPQSVTSQLIQCRVALEVEDPLHRSDQRLCVVVFNEHCDESNQ